MADEQFERTTFSKLISEGALEIKRLERAVGVLARPNLRRDALPVSKQRLLDFRNVRFHGACPRLIAGRLRCGSANSRHHPKKQQRRPDAFTHASTPVVVGVPAAGLLQGAHGGAHDMRP